MKYEPPYGSPGSNDPYINGNPSTGTMGSIPPAASIENPQREIVAVIADAGLTPSDSQLNQLAQAIQSGKLIYADDTGIVNQLQVLLSPNVAGNFGKGFVIVTKARTANTGATTITVNAAGVWDIVHAEDQSPLNANDINAGQMLALAFDGLHFQLVWSSRSPGGPAYLTAPRIWYVNGTTGSDTFDGTQATIGTGIHGPFKTIQKAADQIPLYNLNGYNVTVNVADGAYASALFHQVNGSGQVYILGNTANPDACVITGVNSSALWLFCGCNVYVDGFTVNSSGTPSGGDALVGIAAYGGNTIVIIGNMTFGNCQGAHLYGMFHALISNRYPGPGTSGYSGPYTTWKITGNAVGNVWLPGHFMRVYANSIYQSNAGGGPVVNIPVGLTFGHSFVACDFASMLIFPAIFSGAGIGAASNGRKFYVSNNSSIATGGGGINYYPGNAAGAADTTTGGYYT